MAPPHSPDLAPLGYHVSPFLDNCINGVNLILTEAHFSPRNGIMMLPKKKTKNGIKFD